MHTAKNLVYDIVSKNESMRKELRDALNSPVGSAKRKLASKKMKLLMSVSKKRIGYQDGIGGAVPPMPRPVEEQKPQGNIVILHQPKRTIKNTQESPIAARQEQYNPRSESFRSMAKNIFLGNTNEISNTDGKGGDGYSFTPSPLSVSFDTKGNLLNAPNINTSTIKSPLLSSRGSILGSPSNNNITQTDNSLSSLGKGNLPGSQTKTTDTYNLNPANAPVKTGGIKAAQSGFVKPTYNERGILLGLKNSVVPEPTTYGTIPALPNLQQTISFNNDIEIAKSQLRNGGDWGSTWNALHAKYPTKTSAELDKLLEKDRYYINGVWINPKTGKPVSAGAPATIGTGTEKPSTESEKPSDQVAIGTDISMPGNTGDIVSGSYGFSTETEGTTPGDATGVNIYAQNLINAYSGRPEALRTALYGDKNKMASFLGVDADQIPDNLSPLLSQMNADEEENLRAEYGIDEMRRSLFNRIYSGINIQKDLENYVTNKDQYISTIDAQKERALTWAQGQDITNPIIAQSVNNYFNYLDTLKGNQEKRYLDLVNDAITQYDNTNKQLEMIYQESYTDFTNELNTTKNITGEWYQKMNNIIDEMYDYVSGIDQRSMDSLDMQIKALEAADKLNKLSLKNDPSDTSDYIRNISHYEKYFPNVNDPGAGSHTRVVTEVDANGEPKAYTNIADFDILEGLIDVSNQEVSGGDMLKPASLIKMYNQKMSEILPNLIDVSEVSDNKASSLGTAVKIYTNAILDFYNNATSGVMDAEASSVMSSYAKDLATNLQSNLNNGIFSSLSNDPATQAKLIAAIKSLVAPKKSGIFGSYQQLTADQITEKLPEWKKANSGSINPSILDAIEQYVKFALPVKGYTPITMFSAAMDIRDVNSTVDVLDGLTPGQLTNIIVEGYSKPLAIIQQH